VKDKTEEARDKMKEHSAVDEPSSE